MSVQEPSGTITALTEDHLANPAYAPAALLDAMLNRLGCKNDAALARELELPPAVLSKLRRRQTSVSSGILVRMHDVTTWPISELRALMGLKSKYAPQ